VAPKTLCSGILILFFVLGFTQNLIFLNEDWMLFLGFQTISFSWFGVSESFP
jgi:hypothetical protein